MKKVLLTLLIAYSFQTVLAQNSREKAKGGTWVVESNVSTPKTQIIKFYNSSLDLIYEETVSNRRIRYGKKRIRKALDRTLELVLSNEKVIKPGTFALVLKSKKTEHFDENM